MAFIKFAGGDAVKPTVYLCILPISRDEARYWPLDIFANFDSSTEKTSNLIYFIMTDTVIMMISLKLKNGRRFEFDRSNHSFL